MPTEAARRARGAGSPATCCPETRLSGPGAGRAVREAERLHHEAAAAAGPAPSGPADDPARGATRRRDAKRPGRGAQLLRSPRVAHVTAPRRLDPVARALSRWAGLKGKKGWVGQRRLDRTGTCKLRVTFFTPSPIIKAAMLTREPAREEAEPQASPASLERSLRWQSHCHTRAGLPPACWTLPGARGSGLP